MYILYGLLILTPCLLGASVEKSDCPDSIETEVLTDLNEDFLGVWYDVFAWGNGRQRRLSCYTIEVLPVSPDEVESRRRECEGSGVSFDWDNVIMKFIITPLPGNPPRLIAQSEDGSHSILDMCYAVDYVMRGVSGSSDYGIAITQSVAELLTRHVPDQAEIDCLAHSLDIAKDYSWTSNLCFNKFENQNEIHTN